MSKECHKQMAVGHEIEGTINLPELHSLKLVSKFLPTELYLSIFSFLSLREDSSWMTYLAVRATCRHLQALVEDHKMWEDQYKKLWVNHDGAKEAHRIELYGDNWCRRYLSRRRPDMYVISRMRIIVRGKKGRMLASQEIATQGKDAWDLLTRFSTVAPPDPAVARWDDQWLEWSYWAEQMLSAVHRAAAVERLGRLRNNEDVPLEDGLAVFDEFFGYPVDPIRKSIDEMAAQCKSKMDPKRKYDDMSLAEHIWDWMRGYGFRGAHDFLNMERHFWHDVLKSRQSNAFTLVSLFIGIARRLGLKAEPVDFPSHVHVRIEKHGSTVPYRLDIYSAMNPARSPMLSEVAIDNVIAMLQIKDSDVRRCREAASVKDMIAREARNIGACLDQGPNSDYWIKLVASYAMVMTLTYLHHDPKHSTEEIVVLATHIRDRVRTLYPLDIGAYVRPLILPALGNVSKKARKALQSCIDVALADEEAPPSFQPCRRDSTSTSNVQYPIGLVVTLTDDGSTFFGVITGWSVDGTKSTNSGVPSTPRTPLYRIKYRSSALPDEPGNHWSWEPQNQLTPFITPTNLRPWSMLSVIRQYITDLGRHFRASVLNDKRMLWVVPAELLAAQYPDDIEAGRAFMNADGIRA